MLAAHMDEVGFYGPSDYLEWSLSGDTLLGIRYTLQTRRGLCLHFIICGSSLVREQDGRLSQ